MVLTDQLYRQVFYFCGRVGVGGRGGGVENLRLKLTSAKVKVEVEAELDKRKQDLVFSVKLQFK